MVTFLSACRRFEATECLVIAEQQTYSSSCSVTVRVPFNKISLVVAQFPISSPLFQPPRLPTVLPIVLPRIYRACSATHFASLHEPLLQDAYTGSKNIASQSISFLVILASLHSLLGFEIFL